MFELSLLELLKRNVDIDSIDPPLPRDLEKYIMAYQMCKTPELAYQMAMQHEHNRIANHYWMDIQSDLSQSMAFLLTLKYVGDSKQTEKFTYLAEGQLWSEFIPPKLSIEFVAEVAMNNDQEKVFKDALGMVETELTRDDAMGTVRYILELASLANRWKYIKIILDMTSFLGPRRMIGIRRLTDVDLIDRVVDEYDLDPVWIAKENENIGGSEVFVDHVLTNY